MTAALRKPLFAVTIALSASLLFVVEPAAAKALLPKFGGAAGVWIACILFFQVTLLAGYLYAYALTRFLKHARADRDTHCASCGERLYPAVDPSGRRRSVRRSSLARDFDCTRGVHRRSISCFIGDEPAAAGLVWRRCAIPIVRAIECGVVGCLAGLSDSH